MLIKIKRLVLYYHKQQLQVAMDNSTIAVLLHLYNRQPLYTGMPIDALTSDDNSMLQLHFDRKAEYPSVVECWLNLVPSIVIVRLNINCLSKLQRNG